MKKNVLFLIPTIALLFTGCSSNNSSSSGSNSYTPIVDIGDDTVEGTFSLTNSSGTAVSAVNGVYTISDGEEYTATGKLENGQIVINAADLAPKLTLNGVSISNSSVSPIFVVTADEITIKAQNSTVNYIYDYRTTDYSADSYKSDDTIGKGAIWVADGDLKIQGKGALAVYSQKNSGIHGKDDVTIKGEATISVKSMNNGIKGNDSITIKETPSIDIVCGNNGLVTTSTDVSSKGNRRGNIEITGGNIQINSYYDGIDAAYDVTIADDTTNSTSPTVSILTNKYSSYSTTTTSSAVNTIRWGGWNPGGGPGGGPGGTSSEAEKADQSAKGIKGTHEIKISGGVVNTTTYDDGIHGNKTSGNTTITYEDSTNAIGNVTISGGTVNILNASDDGVHADGTLTVSGGEINITKSHEGLEGNIINMTGGTVTVNGSDDGVNASSQINVSGGRLDVAVSPSGDTDGIDSNGSITISGGVIITRGPNNQNMSPLDADGSISITGGTTIVVGYAPSNVSSSLTKTQSTSGLSTGSHTVTIGSEVIEYNNSYSYSGKVTVYASATATIK